MDAAATWKLEREGASHVLTIKGDVDLSNSNDLQRTIDRLCVRARDESVVLDLADVRFIDSSGLRALYEGSRRASSPVRLRNPAPHVRRLLEIALPGCFAIDLDGQADAAADGDIDPDAPARTLVDPSADGVEPNEPA